MEKKIFYNLREKIICYSIFFALFFIFSTELLSFFNIVNRFTIIFSWILFLLCLFLSTYKSIKNIFLSYIFINKIKKYFSNLYIILIILIILISTFVIAIIYPPTTPDSMAYHMPRVMSWVQNNNVEFFPTSSTRQLVMSPFAEYVILHLYLITNNDILSNLPQWIAMCLSLVCISLIIKELGGTIRAQIIGVIFAITLPMGILQSTSTQTDYISSVWLVITVYFIIKVINTRLNKYIIYFSLALGIGIFTKQTVYLFALPFCIWLFFDFLVKEKRRIGKIIIIPLIIIIFINLTHYYRNTIIFGNPIGHHSLSYNKKIVNENISTKYVISNIIRNISLNLTLPNTNYNKELRKVIKNYHNKVNIKIDDSKNTFGDFYIYFNLYESHAPNTLHFLLIISLFIFSLFIRSTKKFYKFFFSIVFGFFLFSLILKWQSTGNRLILPLFILSSVSFAFFFDLIKNNIIRNIIISVLFLWSLPYVFYNHTKPLAPSITRQDSNIIIEKPYHSKFSREELYFIQQQDLYTSVKKIINKLETIKCRNIVLVGSQSDYEYPLWAMVKKKFDTRSFKINHIDVKNLSNKLEKKITFEQGCALVYFSNKFKNKKKYKDKFNKEIKFDQIGILY